MKISFITKYPITKQSNGSLFSQGASARFRVALPSMAYSEVGHQIQIITCNTLDQIEKTSIKGDIVFVSKIVCPQTLNYLSNIENKTIITDICDNRIEGHAISSAYQNLIHKSALVVANSKEMENALCKFNKPIFIIEDPVEGEKSKIKDFDFNRINMVWFGHQDGILELKKYITKSKKISLLNSLSLVTGIDKNTILFSSELNKSNLLSPIYQWELDTLKLVAQKSDVAVLQGNNTEFYKTKSHNRLLQASWFGLPVIAYPIPSYGEFNSLAFLAEHLDEALDIFWGTPKTTIASNIQQIQSIIESNYTASQISRKWLNLLKHL